MGGGFHGVEIFYFEAGEEFGFGHVGRDYADALQELVADEFQAGGIEQLFVSGGGAENGIEDYVGEFVLVEEFGDGDGVAAIGEHADFYGGDGDVVG